MNAAVAAKVEMKHIEVESNEMMEAVESLRGNVNLLLDRIQPVLTPLPQSPEAPPPCNPMPVVSPVAEAMRNVTNNIRSIARKVVQYTDWIEL